MKVATLVVFLILFAQSVCASDLGKAVAILETEWAQAYYQNNDAKQKQLYAPLLDKAATLVKHYPQAAEPKIWQANLIASNAAFESSITALSSLDQAKNLLEEAIRINPKALDGAAYVTLGTLYFKVPGWPVSFGDNRLAEQMLKTGLKINPNGIDTHYFYAEFLLYQDRTDEALEHLYKATQAPLRKEQLYADTQLQNQARQALAQAQQHQFAGDNRKLASSLAASSENTTQ